MMKILVFLSLFSCCILVSSAQILPGETIDIDTITYKPKQVFPFDQSFVLKLVLNGKVDPEEAVIFTMDRFGEKIKITKRDYSEHISRMLGYKKGKERRESKRSLKDKDPYSDFKSLDKYISKHLLTAEMIKSYYKDKKTTVHVLMPPLEPNRNYQFVLVLKDPEIIGKAAEFTNYYYLSVNGTDAEIKDKNEEMMIATYHDIVNLKKKATLNFQPPGIEEMKNLILDTLISFDGRAYSNAKELRFFIVKNGTTADTTILKAISDKKYFATLSRAHKTEVKVPTFDSEGNPFAVSTGYKVYVLVLQKGPTILLQSRAFEFEGNTIKDLERSKYVGVDNSIQVRFRIFDKLEENKLKEGQITDDPASLDAAIASANNECLQLLLNALIKCECEDKILAEVLTSDQKDIFKAIQTLRGMSDLSNAERKTVLAGALKISGEKGGSNPTTKASTLKGNIEQISLVIGVINYLSDSVQCLNGLKSDLLTFKGILNENREIYNTIVTNDQSVRNELSEIFNLHYLPAPAATSSTVPATLKSRGSLRIVPDFGLIGVFKGDGSANFSDLVPYIGVQVNFRPINKNIRFKSVKNKTLGHRLSFMTGLTTSSIAISNQREDLFGKNSLLTGLGFRLNNTLRLTGGAVWFKELSENPLSDQKSLSFSPSVGLSVDVEFLELVGGVKKLFSL